MMTTKVLSVAIAALIAQTAAAQTDRAHLPAAIDSIVAAALGNGHTAGMSIGVVRGRDTIVLRGYGKADLELDVPTPDRAVYEIGSVTKQFTAAAILQLAEQHKLSLDDEITKYFPTYPVHGYHLTVRRLLDHTSGIRGYTEIPAFGKIMARSLPRDSVVAMFSATPFDFAPGEAMAYSNSAYFLLGLIVEKVSGQSYERYLQEHLFEPAGMRDSRYCSTSAVVPRRAHGYDVDNDTLRLAAYIDMVWPYAAGAICSTVGDLIAWTQALHGGRLFSAASYHEMITPGKLNDGTVIRYAKGLSLDSVDGHRRISHGGGIPGFQTELSYFPDDSLIVVVLVNTAGGANPEVLSRSIVDVTLGAQSRPSVAFHGRLQDYVGTYAGVARGGKQVVHVAVDSTGKGLVYRAPHQPAESLSYTGGSDTFDHDETALTFVRTDGRVTKLRVDEVYGYNTYTRQP
jgi:CubicO group peptidase (beta-lactamase class C family)